MGRWVRFVLKLAVALALLAVVVRVVPLHDTLRIDEHVLRGRILGEWSAETVRFEPAEGAAISAAFAALQVPGGVLVAKQGANEQGALVTWRPGLARVFREVDPRGLFAALLFFALGMSFMATRWWRLLIGAGCPSRWVEVWRFTALGLFWMMHVVPGGICGVIVSIPWSTRQLP